MDKIAEISKEALEFWGYEIQSTMIMEEMSELTKALCKYKRYGYENSEESIKNNILGEIADVHNMIDQMEMYFGKEKIDEIRLSKLIKTHDKIQKLKEDK